jgi:endonuclease YncB( thermonuclease family)
VTRVVLRASAVQRRAGAIIVLTILLLGSAGPGAARPGDVEQLLRGRVVRVVDGDTISIRDDARRSHRVRLAGCDAPGRGQPFGERAKQNLNALVHGREVEARCHKHDRYGRLVCDVLIGSRDACLEQVREGLAWHYRYFAHEQTPDERARFEDAEARARAARRGIWSGNAPVTPGRRSRRRRASGPRGGARVDSG